MSFPPNQFLGRDAFPTPYFLTVNEEIPGTGPGTFLHAQHVFHLEAMASLRKLSYNHH